MSLGWLIVLGLVVLYVVFLVVLVQTGRMRKWNLSLMLGFALMVRTQRGKGTIEAVSRPKRFWNFFGDVGIVVTLLTMLLITVAFLWAAWFSIQPDSGARAPSASEVIIIPGVTPFVPLWYGLLALIVTLVVHEGGHGVLARANGMRIKSLGLLFAVVPIGAFVEPDEDDLKAAPRRSRLRVFGAGPGVNLTVATLCLVGFAAMVGAIDSHPGIAVAGVIRDSPADAAGMETGDILVAAGAAPLAGYSEFNAFMDQSSPGAQVTFAVRGGGEREAVLGSRWESLTEDQREAVLAGDGEQRIFPGGATAVQYCEQVLEHPYESGPACAEELQGKSFLGISPYLPQYTDSLAHPFSHGPAAFGRLVSLPIGEIGGQPFLSTYLPAFHATPFAPEVFWPLALLVFWIFWINLMVGLTNVLPLVPLDGGHIFRDAFGGLLEKLRPSLDEGRRDLIVRRTAGALGFVILGAFFVQVFGPRFF